MLPLDGAGVGSDDVELPLVEKVTELRFGLTGDSGGPNMEPDTADAELEGWGERLVASTEE